MKKVLLLVIGVGMFFVAGCQTMGPNKKELVTKITREITTKHCSLGSFYSVVMRGNARVEIANGAYGVDIIGIQDNYKCPDIDVNHVLNINTNNENINAIIKICVPKLKSITVFDNATVSTQDFKTNGLSIIAKDNGTINLEGQFGIDKISQFGSGRIDIGWVDTDSLIVEGNGNGPIYLAGHVDNLAVRLTKNARLYARYLRAKKAHSFTTDYALAEIWVSDALGAFAVNNSNIYYYKRPKDITIVTRDHGNVLYPHWVE
jgi:hypothetical protein